METISTDSNSVVFSPRACPSSMSQAQEVRIEQKKEKAKGRVIFWFMLSFITSSKIFLKFL
jgi:hypothetical protein